MTRRTLRSGPVRKLTRPLGLSAAILAIAALAATLVATLTPPTHAADLRYPDLRALPPTELRFDQVRINRVMHQVLRFTAVEWNAGEGPLEANAVYTTPEGRTVVAQRVFGEGGNYIEFEAGQFIYHPTHRHWHFEHFAAYELWPRAEYEQWIASGRQVGAPRWHGTKTTSQGESICMRDSYLVKQLAGTPRRKVYDDCGYVAQGISVGWGDEYDHSLPDQWIDTGESLPPDGEYVVRLVVDPYNLVHESPEKADWSRESPEANEAITYFSHVGATIRQ